MSTEKETKCSFCGMSAKEDINLVVSPDGEAFICSECAKTCSEMFSREQSTETIDLPTPQEINKLLDEYIVGQDDAKKVLCEVYGVEYTDATLDEAVNSITGYDLVQARKLVEEAYQEELKAGTISATDIVKLTGGSGTINETVTRRFNYIFDAWKELVKGTSLEGRFEFDEVKDFGTQWANDFRGGAYDICMGGWSGAAWDPGYFLLAYLSPDYMYSTAWDTSSVQMTFTMKGVAADGGDITETMSLLDWYDCLNGAAGAKYDWSANALPQEKRLQLIAALEKEVLTVYYSVPLYNSFGASLISFKVDYTTYTYNTFMGYGGIRYMTYNYNNSEWDKLVAKNNGQLDYK